MTFRFTHGWYNGRSPVVGHVDTKPALTDRYSSAGSRVIGSVSTGAASRCWPTWARR